MTSATTAMKELLKKHSGFTAAEKSRRKPGFSFWFLQGVYSCRLRFSIEMIKYLICEERSNVMFCGWRYVVK
ncbi:hypothetical protein PB1_07027 [Bacillus methanolicus PB1]|uniref:Uncharacterized protein n=1 Tax=Bacillus methanolicus PB1 TaxID=997296 RepID=I3E0S2_BACMT|nr:hypothetical protein PB1_07027 [Bacillus methanolicus PB1]